MVKLSLRGREEKDKREVKKGVKLFRKGGARKG